MKPILFLLSILVLTGCGSSEQKPQLYKLSGPTMGTTYNISYVAVQEEQRIQETVDSLLVAFNNSLSTYDPQSLISRINANDSSAKADQLIQELFIRSQEIASETQGAFDITVAPLVNAWGFGFKNSKHTDSTTIDSILAFVGYDKIKLQGDRVLKQDQRTMFDFNAIAPGYAVDLICQLFDQKGIVHYLIELGGEVRVKGQNERGKNWSIGIDKPLENAQGRSYAAIIALNNEALVTSGNYRKFYYKNGVKYAHTINPKTGYPVQHSLLSATVITGTDCTTADAYATALMVMGLEPAKQLLQERADLLAYLIYSDEAGQLREYISPALGPRIELLLKETE